MWLGILLTIFITYFISTLFGYVVHWAIHQKWSGPLNKMHLTHHLKLYPAGDYFSDVYRDAGKDDSTFIFALPALPVITAPIFLWWLGILPLPLMITSLIVMLIMILLHIHIHNAFHLRNHFLNRIPILGKWFKNWNDLHYLHHIKFGRNLGIFSFHWDKLFGTLWKVGEKWIGK